MRNTNRPPIQFRDGQPCNHSGCSAHITHPCEGCGRLGARGVAYLPTPNPFLWTYDRAPSQADREAGRISVAYPADGAFAYEVDGVRQIRVADGTVSGGAALDP